MLSFLISGTEIESKCSISFLIEARSFSLTDLTSIDLSGSWTLSDLNEAVLLNEEKVRLDEMKDLETAESTKIWVLEAIGYDENASVDNNS